MGESIYNSKLGLLTLTENDIAETIKEKTGETVPVENINVLEYLLISTTMDDTFLLDLQNAFSTFTKEEVLLLPKINSVVIGDPREKRLITEDNFRDFQDILRLQNNKEITEPPPENETPWQKRMRLSREMVAAIKKKQAAKSSTEQELSVLMEIAKVFGISSDESVYSYSRLVNRYQKKEKWDCDIQMLCAGADSSKIKIQYWSDDSND